MTAENVKLGKLKKRSEFLFVRKGLSKARTHIVIQARKNPDRARGIRVGFTATKKTGNAVLRNRAKRRMRPLAAEFLPVIGKCGYDYVFIARLSTAKANWEDLRKDVEKALLSLA